MLVSDYIHPMPRGGRCRVRIYEDGAWTGPGLTAGAPLLFLCTYLAHRRVRVHKTRSGACCGTLSSVPPDPQDLCTSS